MSIFDENKLFEDNEYHDNEFDDESDPDWSYEYAEVESPEEEAVEGKRRAIEARHMAMDSMLQNEADGDSLCSLGTAEDYCSKAEEYAQFSAYKKAIDICEAGIRFGLHPDLTGSLIRYNGRIGRIDQVHHYLDMQMEEIPRKAWTWRSYSYAIEALIREGSLKNEELLHELVRDYQTFLPMEEKAYLAEFDIEQALGNHEKALAALENAVKSHPAAEECAMKLAEILMQRGDFHRAQEMAIRAVSASAKKQSNIESIDAVMIICLCKDALIWREIADGKKLEVKRIMEAKKLYETMSEHFSMRIILNHYDIEYRMNLLNALIACYSET